MLLTALTACSQLSKMQVSSGHLDAPIPNSEPIPKVDDEMPAAAELNSGIPKTLSHQPYLASPEANIDEPTYSIVVYDTPVKEVLFAIARDSKMNIDIHPAIKGNVTLNALNQTLPAILERLAKQVDLSYQLSGGVLSIAPDQPVLRTYAVDYVNLSRDTTGFIGAAAEIAGTGKGALEGGTNLSGGSNSSRTGISSESKSHFWETLEKNIKDILAETDKEIMVKRGHNLPATSQKGANKADKKTNKETKQETSQADLSKDLDESKNEFKTLYAGTVIINREAGIVNVRATVKQHEKVQEFLEQVLASVRRQVLIEATIVEVRLNDSYQAGIDWVKIAGAGGGLSFAQQLGTQVTVNGLTGLPITTANAFGVKPVAGFVAAYSNTNSRFGNIAASINLLEQFGKTAVLSSPKLMVLNNQTAVLKVVDNLVYFTVKSDTVAGSSGSQAVTTYTSTAHTVPVGVVMTVTPQINRIGHVNINVRPTVSRVVGLANDPTPGLESQIPIIQVREMESMLQIVSGNTAILGGLMQDEALKNTDKVPVLSRLPILGKLFTGHNDANRKTELVIFLRPTVIVNASLESEALSSYQRYLPLPALKRAAEHQAQD
ncbi:phage assembly protein [Methylophilaceae bacterium]